MRWYRLVHDAPSARAALKAAEPPIIVPRDLVQRGLSGVPVAPEVENWRFHQYEGPDAIFKRALNGAFKWALDDEDEADVPVLGAVPGRLAP